MIYFKLGIVLALLAALFFGERYIEQRGADRQLAIDTEAINKKKTEATATLASETDKVHHAEQVLQDFKNHQELQDADHQKTVADLSDRLRRLAGPAGRLRDPNATGCGSGSGSAQGADPAAAADRANDGAQAGGLLSAELSGLLAERAKEADDINNAYASCRADAFKVRTAQSE